jgi:phage tail protein X
VNFTNDILMTCKHYSFRSALKGAGSTTNAGRTTRKVTARCGGNQWLASHSEKLQTVSQDTQVAVSLMMRDIVSQAVTNTADFANVADGSPAVPSGVAVEFSDMATSTNALTTRLICCTLNTNLPEGKPTIE